MHSSPPFPAQHSLTDMPELVDIIDIDGVLLPFGGKARDNDDTKNNNDDGDSFVDGCLFPNRTMHAITALLSRLTSSYVTHVTNDNIIQQYAYNPKIVLSSTWRTQSDLYRI